MVFILLEMIRNRGLTESIENSYQEKRDLFKIYFIIHQNLTETYRDKYNCITFRSEWLNGLQVWHVHVNYYKITCLMLWSWVCIKLIARTRVT